MIMTVSAAYYLADVLRRRTRPQRSSWLVWAVIGIAGFGTADAGGAGPGAYAAAVDGIACTATFVLGLLPRYGKPGGRPSDPLLVAVALAGVALWRFGALSGTAASMLIVGIDCVALWPTLREAWRQPQLECLSSWAADLAGSSTCVAATSTVSVPALAYPVYLVAASGAVLAVLVLRRQLSRTPAAGHVAVPLPPPAGRVVAPDACDVGRTDG
jgi:hypothetical protein